MKRKPILFERIRAKDRHREVIGVIGTHRGAGVTHTSLMLAFYMGEELGKKTALVELNHHHDMDFFHTAYQWSKEDASSFSFHRITFYKDVTEHSLATIYRENYSCYILDLGTDFMAYQDEFIRCSTKIVVGNQSEWNQCKLLQFVQETECYGNESWLYLIPYATSNTVSSLREKMHRMVYQIPFEPNPTMLSQRSLRLFRKLF